MAEKEIIARLKNSIMLLIDEEILQCNKDMDTNAARIVILEAKKVAVLDPENYFKK